MTIHVVQPGETLYGIAGRYGADPELLRQANGVPENGALAVGQALVVQEVRVFHVVQPGQTLSSLARQYGTSQRALYRNNYWLLGNPALQPGQTLVIAYGEEKLGGIFTNGYAYPFIRQRELSAVLPYMTYVTPFTYGITAQGGLLPLDDGRILSEAARLGTAPLMHLSTLTEEDNFSSERAVQLLSDRQRQEELIGQIEAVIARKGYRGWTWTSSTSPERSGRRTRPSLSACGNELRPCRSWWRWRPRPGRTSRDCSTRATITPFWGRRQTTCC